jgi:hypothetical protein
VMTQMYKRKTCVFSPLFFNPVELLVSLPIIRDNSLVLYLVNPSPNTDTDANGFAVARYKGSQTTLEGLGEALRFVPGSSFV